VPLDGIKLGVVYAPISGGPDQIRVSASILDSGEPVSGPQADILLTQFDVEISNSVNTGIASFVLADFNDVGANAPYTMEDSKDITTIAGSDVISISVVATYDAVTWNHVEYLPARFSA